MPACTTPLVQHCTPLRHHTRRPDAWTFTIRQRSHMRPSMVLLLVQIKFFERVKLERSIKKLERMLRGGGGVGGGGVAGNLDCSGAGGGDADGGGSSGEEGSAQGDPPLDPEAARVRLVALKEDLMYVMNFPKVRYHTVTGMRGLSCLVRHMCSACACESPTTNN